MIGEKLLHYHVTGRLGAGGMGEVYRARDTRLGRDVAIKLPPAAVAGDPERVMRLEREARALAALNHPGIAAIHGFEEDAGRRFLVLELVDGESLAQLLFREVPPLRRGLDICRQIAAALEVAHDGGLIHRDLKPGNVMIARDGRVKLLDFGLVRAVHDAAGSEPAAGATLSAQNTLSGAILGTTAYMSPEQARGQAVDRRVDVWAFGCVLYEVLTGRRAFPGDTASDTIVSVLDRDPDWSALPRDTPEAVRSLLERCLRKDAARRLRDIGAARLELEEALDPPRRDTAPVPAPPAKGGWSLRSVLGCAGCLGLATAALAVAVVSWLGWTGRSGAADPEPGARDWSLVGGAADQPAAARLDLTPPPDATLREAALAVSPDGRHVAVAPRLGGDRRLWLLSLDLDEAVPLPGTEGAIEPIWSPDGAELAFAVVDGGSVSLRRTALGSRAVREIARVAGTDCAGGAWDAEGRILFAVVDAQPRGRIHAVPSAGGDARVLLEPGPEASAYLWPQVLPDGRLLFGVASSDDAVHGTWVADAGATAPRERVLPGTVFARYSGTGHLLYVVGGALQARTFDPDAIGDDAGTAVLATSVASTALGLPRRGQFSISRNGVLVYARGAEGGRRLAWFDAEGARLGTAAGLVGPLQVALSRDGRWVAAQMDGGRGVWTADLVRGIAGRLTSGGPEDIDPVWAPDGRSLYFASSRRRGFALYRRDLATGTESLLLDPPQDVYPESVSPDGRHLLYVRRGGGHNDSIWSLDLAGGSEPERLLRVSRGVDEPQVSPDGRWLAYSSQDSGEWEVYVMPFRRGGETRRVSEGGGRQPKWRGDGQELVYATAAGQLVAVPVSGSGGRAELGAPRALFAAGVTSHQFDEFAVAGDGRRFLVITNERGVPWTLSLVLNWTSLLGGGPPPS